MSWGPGGPYVKSRGSGGIKMTVNADVVTVDAYVKGKTINMFDYLGALGVFNDQIGLYWFPAILSPKYFYMSNKEAIKIWKKYNFCNIFGVLGAHTSKIKWNIKYRPLDVCFLLKNNNLSPHIPYPGWIPHIPNPKYFAPHIPYPRFFYPQYPIS